MEKHKFRKIDLNVQGWTIGIAAFCLIIGLAGGFYLIIGFVLAWWFLAIWQLFSGFVNAIKFKSNTHVYYLISAFTYLGLLGLAATGSYDIIGPVLLLGTWVIAFIYLAVTIKQPKEREIEPEFDISDHLILDF